MENIQNKKVDLTKPNVSRQFFRKEPNGSWTQSDGIWEDMAQPKTWDFIGQLLPDYDHDEDVTLSNDLSCVIENEDSWDMEKFVGYHPEYKGYTIEQLVEELEEVNARLHQEAEDYLQNAIEQDEIEVREFPIILVSAITLEDGENTLVTLTCADETDSSCGKEFTVPAKELQNVNCRTLIEDEDFERFQIFYVGNSNEYWCDAKSVDFI